MTPPSYALIRFYTDMRIHKIHCQGSWFMNAPISPVRYRSTGASVSCMFYIAANALSPSIEVERKSTKANMKMAKVSLSSYAPSVLVSLREKHTQGGRGWSSSLDCVNSVQCVRVCAHTCARDRGRGRYM